MDFQLNLKLLCCLSLVLLSEQRNLNKRDLPSLETTSGLQEPADNSIALPYDALDFEEGVKLKELENKAGETDFLNKAGVANESAIEIVFKEPISNKIISIKKCEQEKNDAPDNAVSKIETDSNYLGENLKDHETVVTEKILKDVKKSESSQPSDNRKIIIKEIVKEKIEGISGLNNELTKSKRRPSDNEESKDLLEVKLVDEVKNDLQISADVLPQPINNENHKVVLNSPVIKQFDVNKDNGITKNSKQENISASVGSEKINFLLDTEKADFEKLPITNNLEPLIVDSTNSQPILEYIKQNLKENLHEVIENLPENGLKNNDTLTEEPEDVATTDASFLYNNTDQPKSSLQTEYNDKQTVTETNSTDNLLSENENKGVTSTSPVPLPTNTTNATIGEVKQAEITTEATQFVETKVSTTSSNPITTRRPLFNLIPTRRPITPNPGWFSNLFLPAFLLNPFNSTIFSNNQTQTFGFGIFALPSRWRENWANLFNRNRNTNSSIGIFRDSTPWPTLFNSGKSSNDQITENEKETNVTNSWNPWNYFSGAGILKVSKSQPVNIPSNTQVLHLYFPFRYPFQGRFVKETEANTKDLKVENQLDKVVVQEVPSNNTKDEGNTVKNSITSEEEEKSSLRFEFELPKAIAEFVRGLMGTFMP